METCFSWPSSKLFVLWLVPEMATGYVTDCKYAYEQAVFNVWWIYELWNTVTAHELLLTQQ